MDLKIYFRVFEFRYLMNESRENVLFGDSEHRKRNIIVSIPFIDKNTKILNQVALLSCRRMKTLLVLSFSSFNS